MKDDIIRFRKICDILFKDKGYSKRSICKEMGMSEPTLNKLLTEELSSFARDGSSGMRSSTLGIIQDFNKKHANDFNYRDVLVKLKPGVKERREQELKERAELVESQPPVDSLNLSHGKAKDFNDNKKAQERVTDNANFWIFIRNACDVIPENVTITITVNKSL